jgi:hypothetical protein
MIVEDTKIYFQLKRGMNFRRDYGCVQGITAQTKKIVLPSG